MAISGSAHSSDAGGDLPGERGSSGVPDGGGRSLGDQKLPLLDESVLNDLEGQLEQSDLAWNFARDYVSMWGLRHSRLIASVGGRDRMAALDAVISLKVSSAMVGGLRLAHLAEMLEAAVREGDPCDGADLLAAIAVEGAATANELRLRYTRTNG